MENDSLDIKVDDITIDTTTNTNERVSSEQIKPEATTKYNTKNNLWKNLNERYSHLATRDTSLDILRIVAFFCVISIHFFLHSEFYHQTIEGNKMWLIVVFRGFFMICVPLFMILSGYLMNKKKISIKYYKGIFRILGIYLLASIAETIYLTKFYPNPSSINFQDFVLKILSFDASSYSWYIEMYIGMFLIMPFLNVLYHNLKGSKQKLLLIFTMIVLTSIPCIINTNDLLTPNWWQNPVMSDEYTKIMPNWWGWIGMFPITYYFIGAYFSEYKCKIKARYLAILLIIHVVVAGSYCFGRSKGTEFLFSDWAGWESIINIITASLVFLLITSINTKKWNVVIKNIIKQISSWTLGAYLVSAIFDYHFYPILIERIPEFKPRMSYFFIMIIVIGLCSLTLSALLSLIQYCLNKLFKTIKDICSKAIAEQNTSQN